MLVKTFQFSCECLLSFSLWSTLNYLLAEFPFIDAHSFYLSFCYLYFFIFIDYHLQYRKGKIEIQVN